MSWSRKQARPLAGQSEARRTGRAVALAPAEAPGPLPASIRHCRAALDALARFTADRGVTLCYDRHMSIVAEGEGEIDRFVAGTGNCLFGGGDPTAVAERRMARAGHIDARAARRRAPEQVRAEGPSLLRVVWRCVGMVPDDAGGCIAVAPTLCGARGCNGWLMMKGAYAPDCRTPMQDPRMGAGGRARRGAGDGPRPVGRGAMDGAVRLAPDACETTQAAPVAQAVQEADAPRSAGTDRTVQLFGMDGPRERPAEGDGAVTSCGAGNPVAAILDADLPVRGNPPEREARVAGGAFSVGRAATALDAEWAGRAAPWTGTGTGTGTGP